LLVVDIFYLFTNVTVYLEQQPLVLSYSVMTSPFNQANHTVPVLNNMEARVGSGGQILSDNATAVSSQSTMHTLQPVVVDSGWPASIMSLDPSTGTIVPSFNAAMMMMMMPQAAAQYPVMFTPNQPTSSADKMSHDRFTQMVNMSGNVQSVASGHSTIDVNQLNSLQGNVDTWMKQPNSCDSGQGVDAKDGQQQQGKLPTPPKRPLSAYMRFSKQVS
jgi:hypothetical protein